MNIAQFFAYPLPLYAVFLAFVVIIALFCTIIVFLCKRYRAYKKKTALLLRTAAHDIRSPLTNIKGYADAMRDGMFPPERVDSSLALISDEADRISRLCARLCDENAALSPAAFGICELCAKCFVLLDGALKQKNADVEYNFPEDELYVFADKDAIHEAVYNILSNAVKYVTDGGKITVLAETDGKDVKITVKNTYSGEIPDNKKIFSAGYRAQSGVVGQGLGLYVAQNIFKRHGKALEVLCRDGAFIVKFSLEQAQENKQMF